MNTEAKYHGDLPGLEGIRDAHLSLLRHFKETPLIRSESLSRLFNADVWIKNETVSPIACFKIRGAFTELKRASIIRHVSAAVTSSTGNHGQGVAYAARLLGIPAHVFLPKGANQVKSAAIQMLGATLHYAGHDIDNAKVVARAFASEKGYTFVDDGEGFGVLEGAGTVGLEIAESLVSVDAVFIPVGSGSLAGGAAAAIKSLSPQTRVIGVHAKGSPAMIESFRARRAIERPVDTIAEGLACRIPSNLALRSMLEFVDEAGLVTDEDLLVAVSVLIELAHVLVEPSGAAALAGAWLRRSEIIGQRVVLVLTGANISIEQLQKAMTSPQTWSGECAECL